MKLKEKKEVEPVETGYIIEKINYLREWAYRTPLCVSEEFEIKEVVIVDRGCGLVEVGSAGIKLPELDVFETMSGAETRLKEMNIDKKIESLEHQIGRLNTEMSKLKQRNNKWWRF